jgi:hypothetical protein
MGAYDHLPPKLRHVLAYNDNGGLSPFKMLQDLEAGHVKLSELIRMVSYGQGGKLIKEPPLKPSKQHRRRAYNQASQK